MPGSGSAAKGTQRGNNLDTWCWVDHLPSASLTFSLRYLHLTPMLHCRERLLINLNSWKIEQQMAFARGGKAEWNADGRQSKELTGWLPACLVMPQHHLQLAY